MSNPIKSTSRDYDSILADINTDDDLKNKPEWWKRIWAGVGDVFSTMLDLAYNQTLLDTAKSRRVVADKLALIDYNLTPIQTSSGTVLFYIKGSAGFPVVVALADVVASTTGSVSSSALRFEGRAALNIAASSETFTAAAGTDLLTVARVYLTGEKVRVTTTNTLPAPLAINTDYYVIYISDTTIKLATTLANAYAGTEIDITTAGVGVHTIHLYSSQVTCYQQTMLSRNMICRMWMYLRIQL
jgi:hypothetical protein